MLLLWENKFMLSVLAQSYKRICYYFTLPRKFARFIRVLNRIVLQIYQNEGYVRVKNDSEPDPHEGVAYKQIFKKNQLDIILDNPYCPEAGRNLLSIFFKLQKSFTINKNNIVVARNSALTGYLSPLIKQLELKAIALCQDFSGFLANLPRTSAIYALDPSFSLVIFRNAAYITKLRMNCKDELIVAVKVHISDPNEQSNSIAVENFINQNYADAFYAEKNELYYSDCYLRWFLHNAGFFEVLGPFTSFAGDYDMRSRCIAEEGRYQVLSDKKLHPAFKGISVYRARTKTFIDVATVCNA
jgi:hypothetical protein